MILEKKNFLGRFIANLFSKVEVFSPLLKLKNREEFVWKEEQQLAFERIKKYLTSSLVLMPLKSGRLLKLYVLATDTTIESLLVKENDEGKE